MRCNTDNLDQVTTKRSAWDFSDDKSIWNISMQSDFILKSKNFSLCSKCAIFHKSAYCYFDMSTVFAEVLFKAKTLSASFVNLWDDTSGNLAIKAESKDCALWTMLNCMGDLSLILSETLITNCLHSQWNFLFDSDITFVFEASI